MYQKPEMDVIVLRHRQHLLQMSERKNYRSTDKNPFGNDSDKDEE